MKYPLAKILYALLFFSLNLIAEDNENKPSYHKGKLLTDLSFGSLKSEISARSSPNTLTCLYFLYDVSPLLFSSNTASTNLGIYKVVTYEKPSVENLNSRLSMEYAILDWLGIGASVTNTILRIKKITPGSYLSYPYNYMLPENPTNISPAVGDYYSFRKQEFRLNFATVDLELSLHYPYKIIDPYFRFGQGITPGYPGVIKSSLAGGFRIFWENSYIQIEYLQNFLYGIKLQQTDFLLERGIRFGLGYSWF